MRLFGSPTRSRLLPPTPLLSGSHRRSPRQGQSALNPVRATRPFHATMSSNQSPSASKGSSKLIFAPGENPSDAGTHSGPSQAAQFQVGTLSRSQLSSDPLTQFHKWFTDPKLQGTVPETVTLSTAELPSGRVSSRMVYLKELDEKGGFVVYSNWGTSRKAHDISTNPYASLCFWWKPLERQVRVEGPVERLTDAESQVYFDTRARGSRIGAWASQQSEVLIPVNSRQNGHEAENGGGGGQQEEHGGEGREVGEQDDGRADLEARVEGVKRRFEGVERIPVPEFWGGLRVVPEMIEFWQGRDSRLHDRFRYTKTQDGGWKVDRLSP